MRSGPALSASCVRAASFLSAAGSRPDVWTLSPGPKKCHIFSAGIERLGTMSKTHIFLASAVVLPVLMLAGCKKPASEQPASALKSVYDPRETFAPLTLPTPVNAYRSGDGTPGPDYWQNRADYKI